MGIEALKRDIHALVEKPAGVYTKQVKELNEFAASKPELTLLFSLTREQIHFIKK